MPVNRRLKTFEMLLKFRSMELILKKSALLEIKQDIEETENNIKTMISAIEEAESPKNYDILYMAIAYIKNKESEIQKSRFKIEELKLKESKVNAECMEALSEKIKVEKYIHKIKEQAAKKKSVPE